MATSTNTPGIASTPQPGSSYLFPNPVRGAIAHISTLMAQAGKVKVKVFNAVGDRVLTIEELHPAGKILLHVTVKDWASGAYFYLASMEYDNGVKENQGLRKFVVLH